MYLIVCFSHLDCPRDGDQRLPLEHGGRLTAGEDLRPPHQLGRMPDHQLPMRRFPKLVTFHLSLALTVLVTLLPYGNIFSATVSN